MSAGRSIAAWLLAALLACGAANPVSAEPGPDPDAAAGRSDDGPAPRAAVEIGGVSVVLIAANARLYAFVDRVEDNAPLAEAQVTVTAAGGQPLPLVRAANGLFVAPFNRAGLKSSTFTVAVQSAAGSGQASAELTYGDSLPPPAPGRGGRLADVLIAAALLALAGLLGLFWAGRLPVPDTGRLQEWALRWRVGRRTSSG